MEFTLPAGALAHAVGLVKGCVPARTTIPILNHVMVEATAGQIVVRGTNLDMEATARSGADVAADGAAALPGDILHGIVKRLDKSALVTVKLDSMRALITCGRSRYELRALSPDDFPKRPDVEGGVIFTLPAQSLVSLFDATRYAVGDDENRIYLSGVYLRALDNKIVAMASDGHRFGKRVAPMPAAAECMPPTIVPTGAVREICNALTDIEGDATLTVSKSRVRLDIRDFAFSSSVIDSTYPNVDALIPEPTQPIATVKPKALAAAIERAFVVYSGTDTKAPVARFTTGSHGLDVVAGLPGMDQGTEDVEAVVHSRGEVFLLNAKYLAEMLKLWPEVDLDIQPNGPGAPVLFTAKDVPDMLHIIMPQLR